MKTELKIGYIIEGSTDRAFLVGLKERWCAKATLEKIDFRGTQCRPRDYPRSCKDAQRKGCDLILILTDSHIPDFNANARRERKFLGPEFEHNVIVGVAVRNIECWICADPTYIGQKCQCEVHGLMVDDPKPAFEAALGITRTDKKEREIAILVKEYPRKQMLKNPSFKSFYDKIRDFSQQNNCHIPNEEENA